MTKKKVNEFVCGFATALIAACNLHPEADVFCRDTIEETGYTLDHFKEAGLEQDDVEAIEMITIA